MTMIQDLINKYDATETKLYNLKTKKAIRKAQDELLDISIKISEVIKGIYMVGQPLPNKRFTVLGIIGGLGAIESGRQAKVLDVYTRELVISIPTSEYPDGEVFKVPFLECGKLGRLNLNNLVGAV